MTINGDEYTCFGQPQACFFALAFVFIPTQAQSQTQFEQFRERLFGGESIVSLVAIDQCLPESGRKSVRVSVTGGVSIKAFQIQTEPNTRISYADKHFTVMEDGTPIIELMQYWVFPNDTATFKVSRLSPVTYKPLSEPVIFDCPLGTGLRFVTDTSLTTALNIKYTPEENMANALYASTHNPVLRKASQVISPENITSSDTQKIIDFMIDVGMKEPNMAGLAAPQVGFPFQIIIVNDNALVTDRPALNTVKENSFKVFVNPEIISSSHEKDNDVEGCFSVPGNIGIVPRAKSITVRAYDRSGNKIHLTLSGFAARVFQHEVDHVNGLMYPDRIFQFDSESKMFHLLSNTNNTSEYREKRANEYREAIKTWKAEHGNVDGFTWPDTVSQKTWENLIVQSKPDWKNDPLLPSIKG